MYACACVCVCACVCEHNKETCGFLNNSQVVKTQGGGADWDHFNRNVFLLTFTTLKLLTLRDHLLWETISVLAFILKVEPVPAVSPRSVAAFDLTRHGSFISERRLVSHQAGTPFHQTWLFVIHPQNSLRGRAHFAESCSLQQIINILLKITTEINTLKSCVIITAKLVVRSSSMSIYYSFSQTLVYSGGRLVKMMYLNKNCNTI